MCLIHFTGASPKVCSLTADFLYGARVFPLTTRPLPGILCCLPYLNDTYETSPLDSHYALVEAEQGLESCLTHSLLPSADASPTSNSAELFASTIYLWEFPNSQLGLPKRIFTHTFKSLLIQLPFCSSTNWYKNHRLLEKYVSIAERRGFCFAGEMEHCFTEGSQSWFLQSFSGKRLIPLSVTTTTQQLGRTRYAKTSSQSSRQPGCILYTA